MRTYQDALDYIYGFIDPTRKAASSPAEALINLERVRALLRAVGDPHLGMPSVVVAGTKGKGSTCVMIEAMLRASGLRVGLWASPHLSSYRERIQIDRELISQEDLVDLAGRLQPLIDGFDPEPYGRPSTFDVGFALALRHFAERDVQIAVLEVGLGGRYDATNVITPLVSVISSISYDHMGILGRTLSEIAWNKAGIMKPGVPAVTAPQPPEAVAALEAEAALVGAELYVAAGGGLLGPSGAAPYPLEPAPGRLRGGFQRENARLAVGATMLLAGRGLPVDARAIAEGLATAEWPGRFELVDGAPPILIDGAHNGDSARKLAAAIRDELRFARLILVLGTSRDKDIEAIVAEIVPMAAAVVITRSTHPRAMDLDRVAAITAPHLRGPLALTPEMADALDQARAIAGPGDLICVTGSLFVVAAAREALGLAVAD
ncbi:bifunctional folylpolyglutamate synthase/dihydrofolate synthase [Oscillochloris sp. ZM17-4]|uniref:bifunctional folylpolyglutamate synthase/dihydrofolate synthase n=1 Tax=Oscillochloris sp. ZM17-4 TaxID=2866714 RepID=UPI001C73B192|nr:folylpolyglutamate synthase/dihydrofolate synthase family protein [Oscillochloris sp. ZM17-4]MBX0327552.1 bifunctional folylpolyglutamate synthase/dihydrofolate synthase [Oscillochloris sp. ZM17-4]